MVDDAFNRGDLEAVLDFYEATAVVEMEPGKLARGTAELREFFKRVMGSGASKQLKTNVIEALAGHSNLQTERTRRAQTRLLRPLYYANSLMERGRP